LDYPGIGPLHAHLIDSGRAEAISITDADALKAAYFLSRTEGIIPALETAHAFAALDHMEYQSNDVIVINLSGRGDKDLATFIEHFDQFNS
jgi:tryptophan synthase beta chain